MQFSLAFILQASACSPCYLCVLRAFVVSVCEESRPTPAAPLYASRISLCPLGSWLPLPQLLLQSHDSCPLTDVSTAASGIVFCCSRAAHAAFGKTVEPEQHR